jgi:hypothetical protein
MGNLESASDNYEEGMRDFIFGRLSLASDVFPILSRNYSRRRALISFPISPWILRSANIEILQLWSTSIRQLIFDSKRVTPQHFPLRSHICAWHVSITFDESTKRPSTYLPSPNPCSFALLVPMHTSWRSMVFP